MARRGKIAALPREVREQLNRRLEEEQEGQGLVEWLNSLAATQAVVAAEFGGEAISEANLSNWKHGGYRAWQAQEERRERARQLAEEALELGRDAGEARLAELLGTVAAAELAVAMGEVLDQKAPPQERWPRLQEVLREVSRLRREEERARRLELARQKWEAEQAAAAAKKAEAQKISAFEAAAQRELINGLRKCGDPLSQALAKEMEEKLAQKTVGAPERGTCSVMRDA